MLARGSCYNFNVSNKVRIVNFKKFSEVVFEKLLCCEQDHIWYWYSDITAKDGGLK